MSARLEVSFEECALLAHRVDELAFRLRSAVIGSHVTDRANTAYVATARVLNAAVHCDKVSESLRALASRYRSTEGALATEAHNLLSTLGRWYAPVFTVGVGSLTSGLELLGVVKSSVPHLRSAPPTTCLPTSGFASALERIPTSSAQIRVERLSEIGSSVRTSSERVYVYIGGTQDFALHRSEQPWDMYSNLQALAGVAASDSELAVREAMSRAGVDSRTPVVLVGHSQGGLIAQRIAASGDFNVTDVVTAGAPAHLVDVPTNVRLTSFEHTDDIIPALSGVVLTGSTALYVREKLGPLSASRAASALPAHDLTGYVHTAKQADRSSDPMLRQRKSVLVGDASASCRVSEFEASRSASRGGK